MHDVLFPSHISPTTYIHTFRQGPRAIPPPIMKVHLHEDARGHLHSLKGLPFAHREVLISRNKRGTLKGLHMSPYRKVIYVSSGCIHDFYALQACDGDKEEKPPQVAERVLREGEWLEVPAGAAHGFFCPEDSLVIYLLEDEFDTAKDRTIYWKSPEYRFVHQFLAEYAGELILSPKDATAPYATEYDYLVLGAHGYLGHEVVKALRAAGRKVLAADHALHLSQQTAIEDTIARSRAKYVVCAAGISGKPTIQLSEEHEPETLETNMLDTCNLIRLCRNADVHLTYLGSGLVYSSRSATNNVNSIAATVEISRTEEEEPDLVAKVYCRYRVMLEQVIRRVYKDDLLYLRLLYPCTFDGHPKCFFQKMLSRTSNVNNVGVSLTVVPDLFPLLPRLIEDRRATGIVNFVSQGAVKLPALLEAAGVKHTVAPMSSASLASEVLCTAKLCDLVGEECLRPLSESIPRYAAMHKRTIAES